MILHRRHVLLALAGLAGPAFAQPPKPARPVQGPALSAPRSLMAGAMASTFVSRAPAGARLAIARPGPQTLLALDRRSRTDSTLQLNDIYVARRLVILEQPATSLAPFFCEIR